MWMSPRPTPFLKGGYPLFTIKYPPTPVPTTPYIRPVFPLTLYSKTVSFKGMILHTPSKVNYGICKRLDLIYGLFRRRLDLWKGIPLSRESRERFLMTSQETTDAHFTADFCVRVLYRASRDAWICGDEVEADRLADLAYQTRIDMTPTTTGV